MSDNGIPPLLGAMGSEGDTGVPTDPAAPPPRAAPTVPAGGTTVLRGGEGSANDDVEGGVNVLRGGGNANGNRAVKGYDAAGIPTSDPDRVVAGYDAAGVLTERGPSEAEVTAHQTMARDMLEGRGYFNGQGQFVPPANSEAFREQSMRLQGASWDEINMSKAEREALRAILEKNARHNLVAANYVAK